MNDSEQLDLLRLLPSHDLMKLSGLAPPPQNGAPKKKEIDEEVAPYVRRALIEGLPSKYRSPAHTIALAKRKLFEEKQSSDFNATKNRAALRFRELEKEAEEDSRKRSRRKGAAIGASIAAPITAAAHFGRRAPKALPPKVRAVLLSAGWGAGVGAGAGHLTGGKKKTASDFDIIKNQIVSRFRELEKEAAGSKIPEHKISKRMAQFQRGQRLDTSKPFNATLGAIGGSTLGGMLGILPSAALGRRYGSKVAVPALAASLIGGGILGGKAGANTARLNKEALRKLRYIDAPPDAEKKPLPEGAVLRRMSDYSKLYANTVNKPLQTSFGAVAGGAFGALPALIASGRLPKKVVLPVLAAGVTGGGILGGKAGANYARENKEALKRLKQQRHSSSEKTSSDFEREKLARIFGAHEPQEISEAALPYEHRKKLFESYLKTKAAEPPSGLATSLVGGGAIGGTFGGLSGFGAGRTGKSALLGAALGAAGGAGIGALLRYGDKQEISKAKALKKKDDIDPDLAKRIFARVRAKERNRDTIEAARHRALINAIQYQPYSSRYL